MVISICKFSVHELKPETELRNKSETAFFSHPLCATERHLLNNKKKFLKKAQCFRQLYC